ncbi:MAG: TIR domain-containing protein [Lachnospiraceae bacterium]|nr:TIR domain-containing protein [Lachnospiraceae bacterium]
MNFEELRSQIIASESISDCPKVPLPACKEDQNYIFISYSHIDYKCVYLDLIKLLENHVRFWYDEGLPAGQDWDDVAAKKILSPQCSGVIFYIGEATFFSKSVEKEVRMALEKNASDDNDEGLKVTRGFFAVHLGGLTINKLQRQILRQFEDEELMAKGYDEDRESLLLNTFTGTFIPRSLDASDDKHIPKMVEQIANQFNVIDFSMEIASFAKGRLLDGSNASVLDGYHEWQYNDGAIYKGEWKNNQREGKGKLIISENEFYDGEWQNDQRNGKGAYHYANGDFFYGDWKDDQMVDGKMTYASGRIYEGGWANGKKEGHGVRIGLKGERFEGTWKADKPIQAEGVLDFENGTVYTGTVKDNKFAGYGEMVYKNGNRYEGEWSNNLKNGKGTFTWNNGDTCKGSWKEDKRDGYGELVLINGNHYEGNFTNDTFDGEGTYTWKNGDVYTGEWKNGLRNGLGEARYANGDMYSGDWENDKRHGSGRMDYANGTFYEGEWKNGLRIGKGKGSNTYGNIYEGEWANNTWEGHGTLTYVDGNIIEGVWKNGKMLSAKGKRSYNDGVYDGEFLDNKRSGYGVMDYAKGMRYEGEWKEDKLCGKGKWYPNDAKPEFYYEGDFDRGMYNGQGTQRYADGSVYTGGFKDNKRSGQGTLVESDGKRSEGVWENDKFKEGKAQLVFKNGDEYDGEMADFICNGYGTIRYKNGNTYQGYFKNDKRDGKGTYHFTNGNVYVGEYQSGKRTGYGIMDYAKGTRYEGEWEDGKLCGKGKWIPDVAKPEFFYEGEFRAGQFDGEGTYHYQNGDVYIGQFKNNNRSGFGTMTYANGDRYEGEWKADSSTGNGTFYYKNGHTWKGQFVSGLKCNGYGYMGPQNLRVQGYSEMLSSKVNYYYIGACKEFLRDGEGTVYFANGKTLKGVFRRGMIWDGEGYFPYAGSGGKTTPYVYEGEFKEGCFNGKGHLMINQKVYDGNFVNGKAEGSGVEECPSLGEAYMGEFLAGKRHGEGRLVYEGGSICDGIWENGAFVEGVYSDIDRTGEATLFCYAEGCLSNAQFSAVGIRYQCVGTIEETGEWGYLIIYQNGTTVFIRTGEEDEDNLQNKMMKEHLQGWIHYADKRIFEGSFWTLLIMDGPGTMYFPNGDTFSGEWKMNAFTGTGVYTHADGTTETGRWENDQFVKE